MGRERKKEGLLERTAEVFDLPGDVVAGLPRVELIGKGMGMRGGMKWVLDRIGDDPQADPRLPVYFGYSESPEYAQELCAQFEEKYRPAGVGLHSVGAIIGTHVGPRGAVVSYLKKF